MKKSATIVLFALFLLTACAPKAAESAAEGDVLVVVFNGAETRYTAADLQALGAVQATFREVTYLGVPLKDLLTATGIDPLALRAVKVTALDGFTVNYEPDLFMLPDTLVSYARADGPLAEDELPFRMVLPAAEGKQNPRQIIEIEAIP